MNEGSGNNGSDGTNGTNGTNGGNGFRGNKSTLPSKVCARCGRVMTWRRRWAANWAEVRYCSDACRRQRVGSPAAP